MPQSFFLGYLLCFALITFVEFAVPVPLHLGWSAAGLASLLGLASSAFGLWRISTVQAQPYLTSAAQVHVPLIAGQLLLLAAALVN